MGRAVGTPLNIDIDSNCQIWDLRTGGIFETLKYDHAVTALQFDTRKIAAATGQNGIDVCILLAGTLGSRRDPSRRAFFTAVSRCLLVRIR